jgi:hypothetical protein
VTCSYLACTFGSLLDELLIVSLGPDQAGAGGFTEGQSILDSRNRGVHDLGNILHRLDEVGLTDDDVATILPLQAYPLNL